MVAGTHQGRFFGDEAPEAGFAGAAVTTGAGKIGATESAGAGWMIGVMGDAGWNSADGNGAGWTGERCAGDGWRGAEAFGVVAGDAGDGVAAAVANRARNW